MTDNLEMDNILDQVGVPRDKYGLNEIPLFNLLTGQLLDSKVLKSAVSDYHKPLSRVCSVYARYNKTYVIEFEKDSFRKAVDNVKNRARQEKLDFIKSVETICNFQRKSQFNLISKLVKRTFNRQQMLYREGDRADRVFFIISGDFKITKKVIVMDR